MFYRNSEAGNLPGRCSNMNDFSKLASTEHMLQWLAEDPHASILMAVDNILQQQVSNSKFLNFRVVSDPQWLTGARPATETPDQAVLVRTGVAFEFELVVQDPTGAAYQLNGVYSWVGVNLDDPTKIKL